MSPPHSAHRGTRDDRTLAPFPAWAAACFFVSGAAGLLYEAVWSKQLAYLLGNSLHAVATVVAAFLGGLALGARFLGVPLARRGRGPRNYALLELGVACLGIASLPMLKALDPAFGVLYRALGGESLAFGAARLVLVTAALVPPAALMGATLPVLVEHIERERVGPGLARLYAVNTLGAVAGSVAGGFVLLPGVGLAATTGIAALLNAAAAALAWLGTRTAPTPAAVPAPAAAASAPGPRGATPVPLAGAAGTPRLAIAILFALSGFGALVFQIAWVRLFGLVFGSSVYSFSAVLGVYLTGLAIGSAAVAPFMRRGVSLAGLGRLQLAIAATTAVMLHVFPRVPEWMYAITQRAGSRWLALFGGEVGLVAALILLPCAFLGAVFPVATRLLQSRDGGHATGFGYAVNTAGTIAGTLAAGFLLIPALGVAGTHLAAVLLALAIGVTAIVLERTSDNVPDARGPRRARGLDAVLALIALVGVGVLAFKAPRWDASLMSAGLFRPNEARNVAGRASERRGDGPTVWRGTRMEHVLFYKEGMNGSVLVGTSDATGNRWLRVNGKVEASTNDMETQVMLGLLPAACVDSGARSLVIGLGSGVTTAAVLAGGAGRTDVVELEPAVIEASHFFHAPGEDPLDDPRVRLIVGDARTLVQHGDTRYGLIVSEPSNPWMAGVNNLFTVDFYRLVRSRLETRGVFCQWIQLYELTPATLASMLRSFLAVFPDGHAFVVWRDEDLLLVAGPPSASLSLDRLRGAAARAMLARAQVGSPEDLAAYYSGPFASLEPLTHGAPFNRDDRPIVEYRAPRDLVMARAHGEPPAAESLPFAGPRPAGPLYAAWPEEVWLEARGRYFVERGLPERADVVASAAAAAGFPDAGRRLTEAANDAARRARILAALDRVREASLAGRTEEGLRILEAAARADRSDPFVWPLLANQQRIAGHLARAESTLASAPATDADAARAQAAMVRGHIEMDRSRPDAAAPHFRAAERLQPDLAEYYLLEAEALRAARNLPAAREALRRGLEAQPGNAEMKRAQAALEGR